MRRRTSVPRLVRDLSIERKLALIAVITSGVTLILAASAYLIHDRIAFGLDLKRDLAALAEIVGNNATGALSFDDVAAAEEILAALAAKPHVTLACIYGAEGNLFARHRRPDVSHECPGAPPRGEGFDGGYVSIVRRVDLAGEKIATVFLQSDLGEMAARQRRYAGIAVAVLLAASLAGALLSSWLHGWISAPVLALVDTARIVSAEKKYSVRAPKGGEDEIGLLSDTFNEMLGRIEESDRALRVAKNDAEAANGHKSEFLASMSHELRTPLNSIIGFSDVLLRKGHGELNPRQEEYLRDVLDSGRHLLSLINDVLDLAKVEAGRAELDLGMFDLAKVLEASLVMVKERALAHDIRLSLEVGDGIGAITGDERKVKQILFNLLANAAKFTPDGGRIGIRAQRREGMIEIAVSDTGVGIAPENHLRIFEAFRQAGDRLTGKSEGTGLGLTLAKRFVELHGGTIRVESAPGRGATFVFTLPQETGKDAPAPPAPDDRPAVPDRRQVPGQRSRALVLVVEDDAHSRKLARDVLELEGHSIIEAETAERGIALALERRPDLILMDVQLPGMDGREALEVLRGEPATRSIPVIALTALAMKGDREGLLERGFDGYLAKPVEVAELSRIAGSALKRQAERPET